MQSFADMDDYKHFANVAFKQGVESKHDNNEGTNPINMALSNVTHHSYGVSDITSENTESTVLSLYFATIWK